MLKATPVAKGELIADDENSSDSKYLHIICLDTNPEQAKKVYESLNINMLSGIRQNNKQNSSKGRYSHKFKQAKKILQNKVSSFKTTDFDSSTESKLLKI